MRTVRSGCVVLADRHHGVTEGVRGLLATLFEVVVMVADEASLVESVSRLDPALAVVELTLTPGEQLGWLRRLRAVCPRTKVIVLSIYDEPSARAATLAAGADAFVVKRDIVTKLVPTIEALLLGKHIA